MNYETKSKGKKRVHNRKFTHVDVFNKITHRKMSHKKKILEVIGYKLGAQHFVRR